MLPEPSLTLSVPSLHDGLPIDCRVYHPSPSAPSCPKHAAVIAHPYAPLGGCYDDAVVGMVAGTLLPLGFVVVTFNFRLASFPAATLMPSSRPADTFPPLI